MFGEIGGVAKSMPIYGRGGVKTKYKLMCAGV